MDLIRNRLVPVLGSVALVAVVAIALAGDDEGGDADKAADTAGEDDAGEPIAGPAFKSKSALCRALQCTQEQDGEVREIVAAYAEAKEASDVSIKAAHKSLKALYAADTLDDTAMQAAYATVATQHSDTVQAAHAGLVEMHALLGPEQRATLATMIAKYGPLQPFKVAAKKAKKKKKKKKKKAKQPSRRQRPDAALGPDPRRLTKQRQDELE